MNPDLDWYRFAPLDTDIRTALSDVTGAAYDGKAKLYEKLVANRTYNRVVWGASPADYQAFALPFADAVFDTERGFGRIYMNQLRKRGEFGQPLSEAQTLDLFFTLGLHPHHHRIGNMLFISG